MDETGDRHQQPCDRAGDLLGAPDYLPIEEQLEIAINEIAALHDEIGRLTRASKALRDKAITYLSAFRGNRTQRIIGIKKRLSSLQSRRVSLGWGQYARKMAWILLRSRKVDTIKAPNPNAVDLASELPVVKSHYAGDEPIRRAIYKAEYDTAHVWSRALLPKHGENINFLTLVREVQSKRGSLSTVLSITNAISLKTNTAPLSVRKIEGRLREISGWTPHIAGPFNKIEPSGDNVIVHLVKESVPYKANGFSTRSQQNMIALRAAGFRPVVVTELGFPRRDGVSDFARYEVIDGIEHYRLDLGAKSAKDIPIDVWLQEFAQVAYAKILEIRPAVLHVSSGRRGYETMLVGRAIKEKTGIPLVYEHRSFFESTWTSDLNYGERGETFTKRLEVERQCLKDADAVITLGEAMRQELITIGCAPEKIHIVPNGVDTEAFIPRPRNMALADQYDIGDMKTFGYVSNMDHLREGQEVLIEAAALLKNGGYPMKCVLVGGGPRQENLENLARKLEVEDSVVFTGAVAHEDIQDYYGLIDIFVIPRIAERAARLVTPLKPYEAMAMRRPVIVSDLPALREIADPPNRGLAFRPGDAFDLASKIRHIASTPDLGSKIADAGYRWVIEHRNWDSNSRVYTEAFQNARENSLKRPQEKK